jgi:hypothetical protein
MGVVAGLCRFGYVFIVGDDWTVADDVVPALVAIAWLAGNDVSAWWLMPLATAALLFESPRRATRGSGENSARSARRRECR